MSQDVKLVCASCEVCGRRGKPTGRKNARMQSYCPGAPFERLLIDTLGPLPTTTSGNRYIVGVVDAFTKWPEAYAVPDIKAETVAKGLVANVISRFGVPRALHSDQGTSFENDVFQDVCRILGAQKTRTTPMRPQSNGQIERFNRTLTDMLAKMGEGKQDNWDENLPVALLAYRATEHVATGFSPAFMVLGRDLTLPVQLRVGMSPGNEPATTFGRKLREQLDRAHEAARQHLRGKLQSAKKRYDVQGKEPQFQVGDQVWYHWPRRKVGLCPKLQSPWVGPCRVVKKLSDVVFRIVLPEGTRRVVHADKLAVFEGGE